MRMVVMAVVVPVAMVVDQGLVDVFVCMTFGEEEVASQRHEGEGGSELDLGRGPEYQQRENHG